jgi:DNA-binding CsgD family transcriptional regulator
MITRSSAVTSVTCWKPRTLVVVVGEASTEDEAVRRIPALDPTSPCSSSTARRRGPVPRDHGRCRRLRLKQIRSSDLVDAVRRVAAGQQLLDLAVTARVMERLRQGPEEDELIARLSPEERHVLVLLADGLTNRQIAERLYLAEKTIKNYLTSVLSKLGMTRGTEAAVYAARHLDPPAAPAT